MEKGSKLQTWKISEFCPHNLVEELIFFNSLKFSSALPIANSMVLKVQDQTVCYNSTSVLKLCLFVMEFELDGLMKGNVRA